MRLRKTTYVLFGILAVAFIGAILVWIFQPLEAKGKDDKGGVPHPTPTVSAQGTPTISVGPTATPTALRGRRYTNKVAGYSVIVPDGWKVELPNRGISFLVRELQQREGEPPLFRLQAAFAPNNALKENLSKGGSQPNCVEAKHSIEIDGLAAERWVCDSSDGQNRWTQVTVERGNVLYWFGGPVFLEDLERDFPLFDGILASIKFVPIEAPPPEQPSPVP